MKISNKNIRRVLRIIIISMFVIAVGDIVFSQLNGSMSELFKGYLFIVFPVFIALAYTVVGLPVFYFDGEAEVLHIKSHLAFGNFIGKEVYIVKDNISTMQVDSSGIRKKLHIYYLKNGVECKETFSISLLSKSQLKKLMKYAKTVSAEVKKNEPTHMFI